MLQYIQDLQLDISDVVHLFM